MSVTASYRVCISRQNNVLFFSIHVPNTNCHVIRRRSKHSTGQWVKTYRVDLFCMTYCHSHRMKMIRNSVAGGDNMLTQLYHTISHQTVYIFVSKVLCIQQIQLINRKRSATFEIYRRFSQCFINSIFRNCPNPYLRIITR